MSAVRAVIYCRISTDEDLQRYSLANQEVVLRQYAERQGWDVAACHKDQISGSKAQRPGLKAVFDVLAEGGADAVLVTEQDRLSRLDAIEWEHLKRAFCSLGAKIYTLSGEVDFSNEDQEFTADLLALIDRRRRKTIIRQMVRGKAAAARRGEWQGSPPYGYRRSPDGHLIIHEEEAETVRAIHRAYVRGDGGAPTLAKRFGLPKDIVLRVLRGKAYIGTLVYDIGDEVIEVPGAHPAIIPEAIWRESNAILAERGTQYKWARKHARSGLVAGMVMCGECGVPLIPQQARPHNGRAVYYYYCHRYRVGMVDGRRCRMSTRTEPVDGKVLDVLRTIATSPAAARSLLRVVGDPASAKEAQAAMDQVRAAMDGIERRRKRLLALYLDGSWDRRTLDEERRRLDLQQKELTEERDRLAGKVALARQESLDLALLAEAFAAALDVDRLAYGEQRALVRRLVRRVTVRASGEVTVEILVPFAKTADKVSSNGGSEQIRTVDKQRLREKVTSLDPQVMAKVAEALGISLGLKEEWAWRGRA